MPNHSQLKEMRSEIATKFGSNAKNTGAPQTQIALITQRINELNKHFADHKKDHSSKRGLLKLVGQRKRLLTYLKNTDEKAYVKLIQDLELRK